MIVGFVEVQFDLYSRVSMTRGAASPIGDAVSVRR